MAVRNTYRPGDFLRQCDRTGFTVYGSDTKEEWTGLIVRDQSWEPRHPQDFVRVVPDHQAVHQARPIPTTTPTVGPLVTSLSTDGDPGDTVLSVVSASGMTHGDTIQVTLDNGSLRTTIATEGATSLTIAAQLPGIASRNNTVVDVTATTTATDSF